VLLLQLISLSPEVFTVDLILCTSRVPCEDTVQIHPSPSPNPPSSG
jgi:hypothetical protein